MDNDREFKVAIVGSGPSGCYTAHFLRRAWPNAEITIFEVLPTPYGLVRYGIAPDHQGTKQVARQFERLFTKENVRLAANLNIGSQLPWTAVLDAFDLVVDARGAHVDRTLGVSRTSHDRVVPSGALIRALNGFPGQADRLSFLNALGERVLVIGNGNVAMDVVRLLAKRYEHFINSDIDDAALDRLQTGQISRIDVVGRSCASDAKFDLQNLRAIAALDHVTLNIKTANTNDASDKEKEILAICEATTARAAGSLEILLHFGFRPNSIEDPPNVGGLTASFTSKEGTLLKIDADTIVTAIGFEGSEHDRYEHLVEAKEKVWRVGWARRPGVGGLAESRLDAKKTATEILEAAEDGRLTPEKPGYQSILPLIESRVVDFAGCKRIDDLEIKMASTNRVRRKITLYDDLVRVAQG